MEEGESERVRMDDERVDGLSGELRWMRDCRILERRRRHRLIILSNISCPRTSGDLSGCRGSRVRALHTANTYTAMRPHPDPPPIMSQPWSPKRSIAEGTSPVPAHAAALIVPSQRHPMRARPDAPAGDPPR